jgi:hypothetical protein
MSKGNVSRKCKIIVSPGVEPGTTGHEPVNRPPVEPTQKKLLFLFLLSVTLTFSFQFLIFNF